MQRVDIHTTASVTHLFTSYHPIAVQAAVANEIQAFPSGKYLIMIPFGPHVSGSYGINTPSSQKIRLQTEGAYPYESDIWFPKAFSRSLEGLKCLQCLR